MPIEQVRCLHGAKCSDAWGGVKLLSKNVQCNLTHSLYIANEINVVTILLDADPSWTSKLNCRSRASTAPCGSNTAHTVTNPSDSVTEYELSSSPITGTG